MSIYTQKPSTNRYQFANSARILNRARKSVAAGANSTMRVLDYHLPLVVDQAEGPYIWDVDHNRYIDLNMGYGPLIFGHRPKFLLDAIREELDRRGTTVGFPHELSHQAAELIKKSIPSIDLLRFCSTGTETVQSAIRLARSYTGRTIIVDFEGHYHGSSDSVFHRYHSPVEQLENQVEYHSISGTGGMGGAPHNLYVIPWNDTALFAEFMKKNGEQIAGVIMEPVMANSGVIPPKNDFLHSVRKLTQEYGTLLIFDEVITGFRVAQGGAQKRFGITPDITTLSKAMNGGVPVGAIGGSQEIMELMANETVFHGGVYSGNPMSIAGTLATQQMYDQHGKEIFSNLQNASDRLAGGLKEIFSALHIPIVIQYVGPMLSLRFMKDDDSMPPLSYREVFQRADAEKYIRFQHMLQRNGVYLHPNHHEPCYLSTAHTPEIIEQVLDRIEGVSENLNN